MEIMVRNVLIDELGVKKLRYDIAAQNCYLKHR